MTTIVFRDGLMAADSRAYSGDRHPVGIKTKIHRLPDGSLFGASSNKVGLVDKMRRLTEEKGVDAILEKEIDVKALLIKPDGRAFIFNDQDAWSGPIEADFFAVGSGEEYAYAAMLMGADAVKAVEIAIECDVWSGPPVKTLRLGGNE